MCAEGVPKKDQCDYVAEDDVHKKTEAGTEVPASHSLL